MAKILITGGSGMIGQEISEQLMLEGQHEVTHLSRNPSKDREFRSFHWDVEHGTIDKEAIEGVNIIIHLSGASIAQRWTEKNKRSIIDSRVKSAELLLQAVKELKPPLKSFISISGVGIYGGDTGDSWLDEKTEVGKDFVARVAIEWEKAADQFKEICQVSKFRTGVVLSEKGGALPKIALPVQYGVGAAIGSGTQYMSWIHIQDLAGIFKQAVQGKLSGTFNAVSDVPVTNNHFTKVLARVLGKPFFLPNIPAFLMRLYLGEMSVLITGGNRVSNEKVKKSGFQFKFADLELAIKDLLT